MVVERERFPARKKFRKLTPEEAKQQSDRVLADPKIQSAIAEVRRQRELGIPGVPWSKLKHKHGRS